jgi:hypothetical protein
MKMIKYRDESGESGVIVNIDDLHGVVEGFFDLSHHGTPECLPYLLELEQLEEVNNG